METPQAVIQAAQGLVQMFGPSFEYLGEHNGNDVYMFAFPDGTYTCEPYLFLDDKRRPVATQIAGAAAVELLSLLDVK